MFTFPSSMFSSSGSAPPPFNSLLDKTAAYFTFDNTTSNLISPDSTGNYRFYFQYDSANYTTALVGSGVQPYLDGSSSTPEMYIQTVGGSEVATDINFDLPSSGFISIALWIHFPNLGTSSANVFYQDDGDYALDIVYSSGSLYPTLVVKDDANTEYTIATTAVESLDLDDNPIWYLIGIEVNKVSGDYKIRINTDTPVVGTGVYTTYGADGGRCKFSKSVSSSGLGFVVDRFHVCNAALTDPEWDYLYDTGAGTKTYPFSDFV